MSTIRVRKNENYSIIANHCFNDERLSYRAIGLLCHLLSKPNDWQVQIADLVRSHREGRDAVYATINELIDCGYISRDKGFQTVSYIVREQPDLSGIQCRESQDTAFQDAVMPDALLRTELDQELRGEPRTEIPRTREKSGFAPERGNVATLVGAGSSPANQTTLAAREEKDPSVGSPSPMKTIPREQMDEATRSLYEDPIFRRWYESYPQHRRNLTMPDAARLLAANDSCPAPEQLAAALGAYKRSTDWQDRGGKYIPGIRRFIEESLWLREADPDGRWKVDGIVYPRRENGGLTWPPGYTPKIEEINSGFYIDADGNLARRVVH